VAAGWHASGLQNSRGRRIGETADAGLDADYSGERQQKALGATAAELLVDEEGGAVFSGGDRGDGGGKGAVEQGREVRPNARSQLVGRLDAGHDKVEV
jgi:hypothetical protein